MAWIDFNTVAGQCAPPSLPQQDRELSLAVVGIGYPNKDKAKSDRRFEILLCKPGEPLALVPEPKNPHDEYAIAVFSIRGLQIGYLSAERAPWIGSKIGAGEEIVAVFQESGATSAVIRVRFGGGEPTLPKKRERLVEPAYDDFVPDPEGPEWGA